MMGGMAAAVLACATEIGAMAAPFAGGGKSPSSSTTGLSTSITSAPSGTSPPGVSMRTCTPSAVSVKSGSVP
jgi:hypothetical protein